MHEEAAAPRRHQYYYDPKIISLEAMRIEAQWYSEKGGWTGRVAGTTIHYHKHGEPCEGHTHEEFEPGAVTSTGS